LKYGYHQILVVGNSFFCVTNALAIFMDYVNRIFHEILDKFVVVFIDDILIYSKNHWKHERHLKIVLQILKERKWSKWYQDMWYHKVAS